MPDNEVIKAKKPPKRERVRFKAGEEVEVDVLNNKFRALVVQDVVINPLKSDYEQYVTVCNIVDGIFYIQPIIAAFVTIIDEA